MPVVNGLPGTVALATGTARQDEYSEDSAIVEVPLSAPVTQEAGKQYAVVMLYPAEEGRSYVWGVALGAEGYAGGNGFYQTGADPTTWQLGTHDLPFKTFVVPNAN